CERGNEARWRTGKSACGGGEFLGQIGVIAEQDRNSRRRLETGRDRGKVAWAAAIEGEAGTRAGEIRGAGKLVTDRLPAGAVGEHPAAAIEPARDHRRIGRGTREPLREEARAGAGDRAVDGGDQAAFPVAGKGRVDL